MMNENKTIHILGIPYTIKEVDVVDKYEPSNGMIEYNQCIIKIDKTLPIDLKNRVLMHEILHGILDLLGYHEDSNDEKKVQGLATALHLLFTSRDSIFYV